MWPLSIWKNYVKDKERKKQLQEKLARLEIEEMKLSLEWNGMLVGLQHNTVLSSNTESGLAKEYKAFLSPNSNGRAGGFGSLYAVKVTGRSFVGGTHYLFLTYSQLDLVTGVSQFKYKDVVQKYDEISAEIANVRLQLAEKLRFRFFN
jgi:hypothetical protein